MVHGALRLNRQLLILQNYLSATETVELGEVLHSESNEVNQSDDLNPTLPPSPTLTVIVDVTFKDKDSTKTQQ